MYADLPVASTRCPVCGSKRIVRLYNKAPGLLRSRALGHAESLANAEAQLVRNDGKDARLRGEKMGAPSFAVPISQLGALGVSVPPGKGTLRYGAATPVLKAVAGGGPRPAAGSLRDQKSAQMMGSR